MITIDGKYCSADVYVAGYDKLDSASYGQIVQLLSVPCMKGAKIAIMPDVHAGVGACVGYTQTVTDTIVPNLVGVDVACGMLVCKPRRLRALGQAHSLEHSVWNGAQKDFAQVCEER